MRIMEATGYAVAAGSGLTLKAAPEPRPTWRATHDTALDAARAALGKRPKAKPPVGKRIAAVVAYARATPAHSATPWTLAEVQVIADVVLDWLDLDPVSEMSLAKAIQAWADGGPRDIEPDASGRRVRKQFYKFPPLRQPVAAPRPAAEPLRLAA